MNELSTSQIKLYYEDKMKMIKASRSKSGSGGGPQANQRVSNYSGFNEDLSGQSVIINSGLQFKSPDEFYWRNQRWLKERDNLR